MRRKGVLYDVGRVMYGDWRPDYHPDLVRRELRIIAEDLQCTAVKICGRSLDRLVYASEVALDLGLEVWFSPELWGRDPATTLGYIAAGARAAQTLHRRRPGSVVFSVGTELSLFMRGILPGRTLRRRVRYALTHPTPARPDAPLRPFLSSAVTAVRPHFHGPVTYSSLLFERVDWAPFDIVGVDHYWDSQIADRYVEILEHWLGKGKPVVVTEFGCRTRTGADQTGGAGPENIAAVSMVLHLIPGIRQLMTGPTTVPGRDERRPTHQLIRRIVRPRVRTIHERDETHQAESLVRQLAMLDGVGVDGAFIHTFVSPGNVHDADPRFDLDTDSFSLVKTLPFGRHGMTYPDLGWEPKESFHAVARYYAGKRPAATSSPPG